LIPTALTDAEAAFLTRLGSRRTVYEAGALLGASTLALAKDAKFVVSVDPHDGYPRHAPRPTWAPFLANIASVLHKVQPIRACFQDAPPRAAFDLAFADLTGEEELTWLFLKHTEHVRLVAVHDYQRTGCDGATRAIDNYIRSRRPHVMRVDSLVLLDKWN